VALFSVFDDRVDCASEYILRRVMRVAERTIDQDDQAPLVPDLTLERGRSSLWQAKATIIS
jgi:hypothetical protein